jgi:hypothetical protein
MGQSLSYGLNQFEVDELIALCNGCCELHCLVLFNIVSILVCKLIHISSRSLSVSHTHIMHVQSPKLKSAHSIRDLGPSIVGER